MGRVGEAKGRAGKVEGKEGGSTGDNRTDRSRWNRKIGLMTAWNGF